ncbi:MAG: GGDEF domain-containing protein [Acidimicrobiales bacterium]
MSANRGLFGRNRGPSQEHTPDSDSGKSSKQRKREEAAEQSVALLGEVAAGYYGGDPSANPGMLALPPAPPAYIPEPLDDHPHLGFIPIELPGGALLPSEEAFDDETDNDDEAPGTSRRFRRGSRRRRRRARLEAEAAAEAAGKARFSSSSTSPMFELTAGTPDYSDNVSYATDDEAGFSPPDEIAPDAFEWPADLDHLDDESPQEIEAEPVGAFVAEPVAAYEPFVFEASATVAPEPEPAYDSAFAPSVYAQTPFSESTVPAPAPVAQDTSTDSVQLIDRREGSAKPLTVVTPKSERADRLGRGLELVFDAPHLWTLSSRVIGQVVPNANAQLLTTDAEGALDESLTAGPNISHSGCTVPDREMCPAMRLDRVMRFESSEFLDACPFLAIRKGEPVSAVCIPFRSQRTLSGVLHTTAPVDAPTTAAQADELTVALALIGKRNSEISGITSEESGAEILEATIEDLVQRSIPFAVALVHLDNFRLYNRAHGLEIGDAAVQRFHQIARNVVRPEDLVAGDGGDEFFMVFPQTTAKGAAVVCDRIRNELAASFVDHGVPRFTVSIGVADTDDGATFDELLAVIERAVVHAEAAGHDLVVSTKIIAARQDDRIQDLTTH